MLPKQRKNTVLPYFFFLNMFKYVLKIVINCNNKTIYPLRI